MTTKPSDMKPSERIFAGNKADGWSLADHRAALSVIAGILDEHHAAGQGEPIGGFPARFAESVEVLGVDKFTTDPVAAGPELSPCPGCGELFQPNDGIGGNTCSKCCDKPLPVAAPPVVYAKQASYKRNASEAAPPAQPVAAEPAVPAAGEATSEHRRLAAELAAELHYAPNGWKHRQVLRWVDTGEWNAGIGDAMPRVAQAIAKVEHASLTQVEQLKGKLELCHEAHATMLTNWSNEQRAHGDTKRTLTAANERAARLEAELVQLRNVEDALIFLDAHTVNYCDAEGFLEECRALGWKPGAGAARCVEDDDYSPTVDGAPPPVATGERPIVVGSVWSAGSYQVRVTGLDGLDGEYVHYRVETGNLIGSGRYTRVAFRKGHTWVSDPPTPATGGEGEA